MDNGKRLTATHIKYLFAVMELDSAGRGARCVDVAAAPFCIPGNPVWGQTFSPFLRIMRQVR